MPIERLLAAHAGEAAFVEAIWQQRNVLVKHDAIPLSLAAARDYAHQVRTGSGALYDTGGGR